MSGSQSKPCLITTAHSFNQYWYADWWQLLETRHTAAPEAMDDTAGA